MSILHHGISTIDVRVCHTRSMKKGAVEDGLVYHAGFPNAGEDQHGRSLSLDKLVVKHRASTYFWRLEAAVKELHWEAGAIVVVDRALPPHDGRIVVAIVTDDFMLCRIRRDAFHLLDGSIAPSDTRLWGIVTYVLQPITALGLS